VGKNIDTQSFNHYSGWSFVANLRDDAGLVLNRVNHASHGFATDMRVVQVYVYPGGPDKFGVYQNRPYVLGSTECPATGKIQVDESPTFSLLRPYRPALPISTTFEAAPPVAGGSQKVAFKQSYVFTEYNKSPSHEPGGLIDAARIYPLLRFEYHGTPGEANPPERIRVDYRFDISLDGSTWNAKGQSPNLAGVFTDDDGINFNINSIFRQAYKPLPLEMTGSGLQGGRSASDCWDNIHHWAKRAILPPTPGAANAAHSHWRWGKISASAPGGSHYSGLGGPGGPLIDPSIAKQNLDFAITGRGPQPAVAAWDTAGAPPSTAVFSDLFTSGRSEPADIKNGSTLTQWWSLEAIRTPEAARQQPDWQGTFFVHGYFFAHGLENTNVLFFAASTLGNFNDPLEKPPLTFASRRRWPKP
jgi:hypothetical protein